MLLPIRKQPVRLVTLLDRWVAVIGGTVLWASMALGLLSDDSASEKYLTTSEVAELLRLPTRTLYAWRYRGFGPPAARVGKRLLYRREAVQKWVRDRESQ
jgi:excisionase family DNA binding protein